MHATVIGVQRSGTNYLETLLRNNFEDLRIQNQDSNFVWKHRAYPEDVKDKLKNTNDRAIFLIHKNPYKFIESLMRYNADIEKRTGGKAGEYKEKYTNEQPGDIIVKDKRGKKSNVGGAIRLWNDLNKNWTTTDLCKVFVVRYEDLLDDDMRKKILDEIQTTYNLKRKGGKGWVNPEKVGQSDKWNKKKSDDYLNLEQFDKLEQQHVDLINKYIDKDLMLQFRYPIVEERGWSINKRRA